MSNLDDEVWKYVENNPIYAVSNLGRVVNLKFDRVLTPVVTKNGYYKVTLREEGRSVQLYVHQLVAEAFFGNWRPGLRVTHIDEDKSHNAASNLEVIGAPSRAAPVFKHPKLSARRLRIVETGMVFRTAYDCAAYIGGNATNIYRVLNGHRSSHRGYTFEYVDTEVVD